MTEQNNVTDDLACIEGDLSSISGSHELVAIEGDYQIVDTCSLANCPKFNILFNEDYSYELSGILYYAASDTISFNENGNYSFRCTDRYWTSGRIIVEVVEGQVVLNNGLTEKEIATTLSPDLALQLDLVEGFEGLNFSLFMR